MIAAVSGMNTQSLTCWSRVKSIAIVRKNRANQGLTVLLCPQTPRVQHVIFVAEETQSCTSRVHNS